MNMRGHWAIPVNVRILTIFVLIFGTVSVITSLTDFSAYAVTIQDDPTGGECNQLGTWDPSTKTCTFTHDDNNITSIDIVSDGITIDGNGFKKFAAPNNSGFFATSVNDVTIKNVNIIGALHGINIQQTNGFTITGNTFEGSANGMTIIGGGNHFISGNTFIVYDFHGTGIVLRSSNNEITDNIFSGEDTHPANRGNFGILCSSAVGNLLSNNIFDPNQNVQHGIVLSGGCNDTVVTENTFANHFFSGMQVRGNSGNQIFNNNFINNPNPAIEGSDVTGIVWNLLAPIGGNYWDVFDIPAEGCNDDNSDGFCDDPFVFLFTGVGNQDNLPFVLQNGWNLVDPAPVDVPIGGTFVPIDSTALLLAGVQSISMWMIPVVVAGIGIGVFVIKRRK